MKKSFLSILTFSIFIITSCKKDKNIQKQEEISTLTPIERIIYVDVSEGPTGFKKKFYSLETGLEITGEDTNSSKWDLAFMTTIIYVNSGKSGPGNTIGQNMGNINFDTFEIAPEDGYLSDGNAYDDITIAKNMQKMVFANWWRYELSNLVLNNYVFSLKTNKKKYVKLKILSFNSGKYSFKYTIQPGGSRNFVK